MRSSFWPLLGSALEQQWKGLAKGSSASGVAFSTGRPALRSNFSGAISLLVKRLIVCRTVMMQDVAPCRYLPSGPSWNP